MFDSLAAQTILPMEARLFFWNQGLKPAIQDACYLDPLTHSVYKDIAQAQKAALAADSRFHSAAANAKKHGPPSSGQSLAAAFTPKPKATHYVEWTEGDGGFFNCATNGTMRTAPGFMLEWIAKLPRSGQDNLCCQNLCSSPIGLLDSISTSTAIKSTTGSNALHWQ